MLNLYIQSYLIWETRNFQAHASTNLMNKSSMHMKRKSVKWQIKTADKQQITFSFLSASIVAILSLERISRIPQRFISHLVVPPLNLIIFPSQPQLKAKKGALNYLWIYCWREVSMYKKQINRSCRESSEQFIIAFRIESRLLLEHCYQWLRDGVPTIAMVLSKRVNKITGIGGKGRLNIMNSTSWIPVAGL